MRLLYARHQVRGLFVPDTRDCRDAHKQVGIAGNGKGWFFDPEWKRKAVMGVLDELDDHDWAQRPQISSSCHAT
jgi:hypothetical protein